MTAPALTYQWQLDGIDLANATNATLTVSNVSLADLGCYTVLVRNSWGETKSQPAWLKLARWNEMVVFGASECMAQYSNGKSWVEWLAEQLCLSAPNQIKNYAAGGARTYNVRSQIQQYLSAHTPTTNTLLAPSWAGAGWDLLDHQPVEQVVSNYALNISLLAQAGGRVFILPSIPELFRPPRLRNDAYLKSLDYEDLKARMEQEVRKLQTSFGLTVFWFDFHALTVEILADPVAFGFTNVTEAANAGGQCDANRYFFWDDVHWTTAAHRLISEQMLGCLTPPLLLAVSPGSENGVVQLHWQGGQPPFRVQCVEALWWPDWPSGELTFETNATVHSSAPQEFFRVLQLGQ